MTNSNGDIPSGFPQAGEKLGAYTLDETIGSGAMATVWRAHAPDGQAVALKVLDPSRVLPEELRRFDREYNSLAELDHPNVVRVHGKGSWGIFPWMAMELVEGMDLDELIARWRKVPTLRDMGQIEQIFRGLCRGLEHVHQKGLVHRDLKPSNVLLTSKNTPKISDFGVVKDPGATSHITYAGRLVGTVAYMAPELIAGEEVDSRADLYALGAVLYNMLTLRRPIEADSVAGYLARHLSEVPVAPSELESDVPPHLERVCMRLLRKEPSQRYASPQAILRALDQDPSDCRPPVQGREAETSLWKSRVQRFKDGAGGILAAQGPAGSGKSFLLQALVDVAADAGVEVAELTWRDRVGLKRGDTFLSAHTLLDMPVHEPMLIYADDLDLAPASLVETLGSVIQARVVLEGSPLLILATTTRPRGVLRDLMEGLTTGLASEGYRLGPLQRPAVIEMLRDRGLSGALPRLLGDRLFDDFQGMPGPIIEQLDALRSAGWIKESRGQFRAAVPIKQFRSGVLPVAESTRAALREQLGGLTPRQLELVDLLAIADGPVSLSLLRKTHRGASLMSVLDGLRTMGLVEVDDGARLSHPAAGQVVREMRTPEELQALHASLAESLENMRRNRGQAGQIADHWRLANRWDRALPHYLLAARRAARADRQTEVLRITEAALQAPQDNADATSTRRWMLLLRGTALRELGRAQDAIPFLEEAAALSQGDRDVLPVALTELGRAEYRTGDHAAAQAKLEQALETGSPGSPGRAAALRTLGDLRLRRGDIEGARELLQLALTYAEQIQSRDAEARALRGIANVSGISGDLMTAHRSLQRADELLSADGDPRVRIRVLERMIALDLAAGKLGSALHRAEVLLDIIQNKQFGESLPIAHAAMARTLCRLGRCEPGGEHARQARMFIGPDVLRQPRTRLSIASILLDLGRVAEAKKVLPPSDALDQDPERPATYRLALMARTAEDPQQASVLAQAAVSSLPESPLAASQILLELLKAVPDDPVVWRAVDEHVKGDCLQGLRLECLRRRDRLNPSPELRKLAAELTHRLPVRLRETFARRTSVAEALVARDEERA